MSAPLPRPRLSDDGREILRLAVPALGALVAEPLYVLADTAVVGHLGTGPLGGLGVASAALLFAYGLCIFLAYGTTASVARLTGAGEHRRAADQAVQGLWLALGIGIGLAAVGIPLAGSIVGALGADGDVADHATTYLRISLLGAPGMLLMLAGVGYLRGLKDNVRPLRVAVGTAILNLVLELVLILGLDLGIGASAAATVVAQWTGAACYLARIGRDVRQRRASLGPHPANIIRMLTVSGQLLARNLSLTGMFLVGTSVATRIGRDDVAAHQVAFQVWVAAALAMDAVAIAAQAMVGERLGAGDAASARRIGRRVIAWSAAMGLAMLPVLLATRHGVAGVFSADAQVVSLAAFLLVHVALMAPVGGIAFALDGILIGAGDQAFMARAMAATSVATVAAMVVGRLADLGIGWLWGAIWLATVLRSGIFLTRFAGDRWQVVGAER